MQYYRYIKTSAMCNVRSMKLTYIKQKVEWLRTLGVPTFLNKETIQAHLPCQMVEFPTTYLGLPLSLHKLTRAQIQPIIDKIADQLPRWKADLLTKAGRKILVQFVLTSMLIYLAMAMDLPSWALRAIDKIRRGFLWKGRKEARGGHCLLAWPKVTRPVELGGLGISNLQQLGWALRMRWLWLQKTEPDKPWNFLPIQVHQSVKSFFSMAVVTQVEKWHEHFILD